MAMTRDSAVTPVSARAGSRGIVLAGDRTLSRLLAKRHSRTVRLLKASLPLAGLAISGLYGVSVMKTTGWGAGIPKLEMPNIIPENLAMNNPHYEGFNKDGGRYWVKAETAQQDLKNLSLIKLNAITGELTDAKKAKTGLTATRGTFDNKANVLELYDSIDVSGDAGMTAHLSRATVQTKENIITSDQPVVVTMEAGTINANQMTARQKVKEYTFVDNVRTHLNGRPQAPDAAPKAAAPDQLIGKSGAPVDVTSNRLDINDATKVALFTGGVTAVQDGASLTSPELEVSYEGSATPQAGAAAAEAGPAAASSKVKRMVAKNPVTLKQANGDTVTSQNADFDAVNQTAILDGNVVMTQLPDKRATADKAEIDQTANTVILSGDVVVMQGQNVLRGRRLAFNRQTNKMQLTAPGTSNLGGRISAHFQQQAQSAAAPAAPKPATPAQGLAFGGSFKTDPGSPVVIDATRLDVDDASKKAVFTGDVHAVQGEFVIHAAELTATYTGSAALGGTAADATKQSGAQLTHIRAKTKVKITSKDGQAATGDWADFDPKANTAVLGGDVVLTQGKNILRGTKLNIDMTTGEAIINNDGSSVSNPATVAPDGTATAASSPSGGGRPSAVFYLDDVKKQAAKPGIGPAVPNWQTETAPSKKR
jgi:lipopolysaccharide transport protein LptA/LPS export ABC transporter protein LptC